MFHFTSISRDRKLSRILPWLLIAGAALVVVMTALFASVHSPLGQEISAGESPGFAWIRLHITFLMGVLMAYLILVCWLQIKQLHQDRPSSRILPSLVCVEVVGIALVSLFLLSRQTNIILAALTVLLISILLRALLTLRPPVLTEADRQFGVSTGYSHKPGLFLFLLFAIGATVSFLDPSWRRLSDLIMLDSDWDSTLRYIFPPLLSGITSVWFGTGLMIVVVGFRWLRFRINKQQKITGLIHFLTYFCLSAVYAFIFLITLYQAIPWQIENLNLTITVWQLFIFFSLTGGILFSVIHYKIAAHIPGGQGKSETGVVALSIGSTFLYPVAWLLLCRRNRASNWLPLLITVIGSCLAMGYLVLFGNLFNPWFTAFSYLKGAILMAISVVAAGVGVLIFEDLLSGTTGIQTAMRRPLSILAIAGVMGLLPFYFLDRFPEVKTAVLQYNELSRVNATFARELTGALGLGRWIHLGQRPPPNGKPDPWPQPWHLKKTHSSLLPENFNLLIIVVDALRGDAFHSAGYHRNLTPFLDRWSREEGLSFRRAYSQGGGSFAAYPFLVAGRGRFDLYGPGLYRQNLYFKIARAEGIQHYMLMKGFGPREIYPPDLAVTELSIPREVSDRRSATADEVFDSARRAISALPANERFLCFLTLMDVHNDLYKKEGGVDFGDTPRDLYDNNLSYLDKAFSRFIGWLKTEGLYERSVVLFTSDHGEQFWEHGASLHGHTVYEEEIRIPLILVSHGIKKRIEDVPVIAADMAPTIADMAGYSVDPPYEDPRMGISLLPLIKKNETVRYLERDVVGRASFKRRYFIYRNWEWKLIYLAELDILQLFNVIKDPSEKNNLIDEEPVLAARLEHELFKYLNTAEGKTYRPTLSNE